MVGIVVAAHGHMAEAFLAAAEGIVGTLPRVATVDLRPSEDLQTARERLCAAIASMDEGQGVVVLVDLFGGTPSNCSLSLPTERPVEVVAGFNLPMLLKLATSRAEDRSAAAIAAELVEHGRSHILHASELLRRHRDS